MDTYRTEEEQVEALKQWWKRNGTSTLTGIALVLALYFGWQAWSKRQFAHAEAASISYQQLLLASLQLEQDANDKRFATAAHLSGRLKEDFPGTVYAQYAALLQARLLVQQSKLDAAAAELQWVLDTDPDPSIAQVAQLRLARILHAKGDDQGALAIIDEGSHGEYAAAYDELRGDIQYRAGQIEAARGSYDQALQSAKEGQAANPLVRMKLQSLPGGAQAEDDDAARDS